jgi:AcrR family transcriptional regulator
MQEDSPRPVGARRSPYGANPTLGRHGNRARQEILDAARGLFAERGFHATSVEAIGEASGRSGAAVYQYFEGKGDLFGVLVRELTADVLHQARALGEMERLAPGPAALGEVQRRIGLLSDVVNRHATTFLQWPFAEASEPALRGSAAGFMDSFAHALSPALANAGVPAENRRGLALAMGATALWSRLTQAARAPEVDPGRLDAVLARVAYLALFPLGSLTAPGHDATPGGAPEYVRRPAVAHRPADPGVVPGVRRTITARSRPTMDRIAAAATTVFRRNGFHGTSLGDVAAEAGVSHGSVYTYWPDRSSLFSTLAHRAAVALGDHIESARTGFATAEDGRAWLASWLDVICAHGAVLHIWTHEVLSDEDLGPAARQMEEYVYSFLDGLLRSAPTAGLVDELPARLVQWSLLTDVPYSLSVQTGQVPLPQLRDALGRLLLRGLFGLR